MKTRKSIGVTPSKGVVLPVKRPTLSNAEIEAMLADMNLNAAAIERQINKDTGIWIRAQEQIGIPLPPETRLKISLALTGRKLTHATKAKISASLKAFHAAQLSRTPSN